MAAPARGASGKPASDNFPLDKNQKLSLAGAAASLKYAKPEDLPSYPSAGLSSKSSSAGAAASLAAANQKRFEHWQPDPSASASAAAVLAKDYKVAEIWRPEASTAGSKAAMLAAKDGGNVNIWKPGKSAQGNSAATQALKSSNALSPQLDYGYTDDGHKRSLMAATGALRNSRRRADSTPVPPPSYPDASNASYNALNAATLAHKPSTKQRGDSGSGSAFDPERVHKVARDNVNRDLYSSHPNIGPGADEKQRADVLRAAAISMAKKMYDIQQKTIADASAPASNSSLQAARSVHGRNPSISTVDSLPQGTMQYNNLEEAARKLAAERLAKLHDEHASYRTYYGTNVAPQKRLSMRGRIRRRASSDGESIDTDKERSRRIRTQMSLFNDQLAQVDETKRKKDREALMAAAQRNVQTSMSGMDKKIFEDTGRIAPSLIQDWEAKARTAAENESKSRMVNHGKVDIGGGKFLDQEDVNAVAARNVQPLLDDINEKAEIHRARQEELRLEEEERKRVAKVEKERQEDLKAAEKKVKDEEKSAEQAKKDAQKQEEKAKHEEWIAQKTAVKESAKTQKEEEKAAKQQAKSEEKISKELAKEEARRKKEEEKIQRDIAKIGESTRKDTDKQAAKESAAATAAAKKQADERAAEKEEEDALARDRAEIEARKATTGTDGAPAPVSVAPPTSIAEIAAPSPISPKGESRVKSWIKTKLPIRRASKSQSSPSTDPRSVTTATGPPLLYPPGTTKSTLAEPEETRERDEDASMRQVALAGKPEEEEEIMPARSPSPDISISPPASERGRKRKDEEEERDTFDTALAPPATFVSVRKESPARDSKFHEEL
ncbi:MAG: hypothetical protein M1814_003235 [Vezdaea aestivalis]|nr:MAG: hypothetical protein M1814_003235 [Vezdaea aestivalis]